MREEKGPYQQGETPWWPGGPLCPRTEPHPAHYAAQRLGVVLWRDGLCKGVEEVIERG